MWRSQAGAYMKPWPLYFIIFGTGRYSACYQKRNRHSLSREAFDLQAIQSAKCAKATEAQSVWHKQCVIRLSILSISGTTFNTAWVTKNLRIDNPGTSIKSNIIVLKEIKIKNKRNSKVTPDDTLLYSGQRHFLHSRGEHTDPQAVLVQKMKDLEALSPNEMLPSNSSPQIHGKLSSNLRHQNATQSSLHSKELKRKLENCLGNFRVECCRVVNCSICFLLKYL